MVGMSSSVFRGIACLLGCMLLPAGSASTAPPAPTPLWMAMVDSIARKTLDRPVLGISIALANNDRVVFARAIAEDRIVVTENADDFRKLAAGVDVHPGLIILPSIARLEAQMLMDLVVDYLLRVNAERPQDVLVIQC